MLEAVTLYQGDCLDIMRTLPEASVDAVIADPPYGTTACKWDSVIPFAPMWEQLRRVTKPNAAIVLFASQPFTSALVMSNPHEFKYQWVWEKTVATNFLNSPNRPLTAHEDICVFSRGTIANKSPRRMQYNPQIDHSIEGWQKVAGGCRQRGEGGGVFDRGNRKSTEKGTLRSRNGRMPRSVLHYSNGNDRSAHPTQKPLDLLAYLVRTYTNPGETVLDFCFGSGTTGVACVQEGRRFIGVERDANFFAIAEQRIATAQPPLPLAAD